MLEMQRKQPACRRYVAFGLVFRSSLALPFAPAAGHPKPDVLVRVGGVPPALPAPVADYETWQAEQGAFLLRGTGVADVLVRQGREIVVAPRPANAAAIGSLLGGPAVAALLQQRGLPTLHAGAVTLPDGGAALVLGPTAHGKSSLIAALVARGHRMLADDLVALDWRGRELVVLPAFPALRLWSDALARLDWERRVHWRLRDGIEKHLVPVPEAFEAVPTVVRRCYVLMDARHRETVLTPVAQGTAFRILVRLGYRKYFLASDESKAVSFRAISALAHVPMFSVARLLDGFPLENLTEAVAGHAMVPAAGRRGP